MLKHLVNEVERRDCGQDEQQGEGFGSGLVHCLLHGLQLLGHGLEHFDVLGFLLGDVDEVSGFVQDAAEHFVEMRLIGECIFGGVWVVGLD